MSEALDRAKKNSADDGKGGSVVARLRSLGRELDGAPLFENTIIGLIIVNSIILGLMTSERFMDVFGGLALFLDRLILGVFVLEIAMRFAARGRAYFSSGWSWFDIFVVSIAFAPTAPGLQVLRAFRVFRLLRLFSIVPKMRRVIGGFFLALPGMAGVVGVLGVIFYVSAVITTSAFGHMTLADAAPGATPEDIETVKQLFGTLGRSFFTLFQLMTLENWADGIVVPTMKVAPAAIWFFMPYMVITAFAVLNLFIGIIVDSMQDEREEAVERARRALSETVEEEVDETTAKLDEALSELKALRQEVAALRDDGAPGSQTP